MVGADAKARVSKVACGPECTIAVTTTPELFRVAGGGGNHWSSVRRAFLGSQAEEADNDRSDCGRDSGSVLSDISEASTDSSRVCASDPSHYRLRRNSTSCCTHSVPVSPTSPTAKSRSLRVHTGPSPFLRASLSPKGSPKSPVSLKGSVSAPHSPLSPRSPRGPLPAFSLTKSPVYSQDDFDDLDDLVGASMHVYLTNAAVWGGHVAIEADFSGQS